MSTVLYEDGSWWLENDVDRRNIPVLRLKHQCTEQHGQVVWRGKSSDFHDLKDPGRPCSFCTSVCPVNLQGLYNLLDMV